MALKMQHMLAGDIADLLGLDRHQYILASAEAVDGIETARIAHMQRRALVPGRQVLPPPEPLFLVVHFGLPRLMHDVPAPTALAACRARLLPLPHGRIASNAGRAGPRRNEPRGTAGAS